MKERLQFCTEVGIEYDETCDGARDNAIACAKELALGGGLRIGGAGVDVGSYTIRVLSTEFTDAELRDWKDR